MNKYTLTLITIMAGLFPLVAPAVQPMSAENLRGYCRDVVEFPETAESQLCVAYVNAFIDGAIATDPRVAANVVSEIDGAESFTDRAIRTRVIDRMRRLGPSVYADFCVGQPVPIEEVVGHVRNELEQQDALVDEYAQTVVYSVLRQHYPCTDAGER